MASKNRHEHAARQLKAYRLVAEIERLGSQLTEQCGATGLVSWAHTLTEEQWSKLAICAGCKPPSEKTRALVIEALERRAAA
jgi:hypothetical protein